MDIVEENVQKQGPDIKLSPNRAQRRAAERSNRKKGNQKFTKEN